MSSGHLPPEQRSGRDWMERPAGMDERYEYVEVTRLGSKHSVWVEARCRHIELIPVESLSGEEVVAQLCLTCDSQLPAEWRP